MSNLSRTGFVLECRVQVALAAKSPCLTEHMIDWCWLWLQRKPEETETEARQQQGKIMNIKL